MAFIAKFKQRLVFDDSQLRTVSVLALIFMFMGMNVFGAAPVTSLIMDEYGMSSTKAGFFTGIIPLAFSVLGIPGSLVNSKFGLKNTMVLGSFMCSISIFSFAATGYYMLLATRAIIGLGSILVFTGYGALGSQIFRGRALPIYNVIIPASFAIGIGLGSMIVVPIADVSGWKYSLSVFGAAGGIAALMWRLLIHPRLPVIPIDYIQVKGIFQVLRSRTTALLVFTDIGPYCLITVLMAWLPTYYHQELGWSLFASGSLNGVFNLGAVAAMVLASWLLLRYHRRRPFLIGPGFIIGFAAVATILVDNTIINYLAVFIVGACCWFYVPAWLSIPMELPGTNALRVSITMGVILSASSFFSFVSPIAVGIIKDSLGSYAPGLIAFSVLSWTLLFGGILLPETGVSRPDISN